MSKVGKIFTKTTVKIIVFITVFLFIFSSTIVMSDQDPHSWVYKIPILGQIKHLAESSEKNLKGETEDRINILLLGIGGENHEGGYLTDTIILASLQPSTKKVALLSIPRDMSIPVNKSWMKINSINAYAEANEEGSGGEAISKALSDVLNIPIHYYIRIDFQGFVNIIDELGGIKVNVENTLDDPRYPIAGMEDAEDYESRYEHLYIEAGIHKMDGELALKYARSRHSSGIEGSDFARAHRQQLILEAVKNKLFSKSTLFRPTIIKNIYNELTDHISTNMEIWEMLKLWNMFGDISKENIINKVLDNTANGMLIDMITQEGAYILTPRAGNFSEIEYFVKNIFSEDNLKKMTNIKVDNATLEIKNGTWINGLANQFAQQLKEYGFEIVNISNCSRRDFEKSVIYDLTFGEKINSLSVLKNKTGANVSFEIPQWLQDEIKEQNANIKNPVQPDFLLILGQSAQ